MSGRMVVKMTGVKAMQRWFEKAPERFIMANQKAAAKLAKIAAGHARDLIRAQMFIGASVPLSPAYAARKTKNNDKILIHTGTLLKLIKPIPVDVIGINARWSVGIPLNTYVNGTDYGEVANVLEAGTLDGHIPPRPLWGQVEYHIKTIFRETVLDEYRRAGLIKS